MKGLFKFGNQLLVIHWGEKEHAQTNIDFPKSIAK